MSTSVDVTINATMGTITGSKGAWSEVGENFARVAQGGTEKGLVRSMRGNGEVTKTVGKLFEAGFNRSARNLKAAADELDNRTKASQKEMKRIREQISKSGDADEKKKLDRELQAEKKKLQMETKQLKVRLKREMEAAERRMDLLERADKRSQASWYKTASAAGEKLAGGVTNITSAITSGGVSAEGVAGGATNMASGVLDFAAGKAAQAGMGRAATMLAGAAGTLAVAAGAIVGVVAVMGAAVNQMIEMNKKLTDNIAPIDLMADNTGELSTKLKSLRENVTNAAWAMGSSSDEILEAMGSITNAGFTMKEFARITGQTGNGLNEMVGVTQTAILASRGLGVEVSELGGFMKNITDMGGTLMDVTGSFSLIASSADRAGMRTKDFFTAINEASSGMSLYNFRLNDTVGLFTTLVGVLGEDLAKQKIGLDKSLAGMDFESRYKRTLTTGTGTTKSIFAADAAAQASQFSQMFGGKNIKGLEYLGGAGNINVETLGKMNEKSFQMLLSKINAPNKKDADLAKQQLQNLYQTAKGGMAGNASGVTQGFGGASKLAELAMELGAGKKFLGGKSLSEAAQDPVLRQFLEKQMGMSGEQLEANVRIDRQLRANYQEQKRQAEAEGKEIGTFYEELVKGTLTSDEDLKDIANKDLTRAEKMGQAQLDATTSIADDIKNLIAVILEKIAGFIENIMNGLRWFFGKDDAEGVAVRDRMQLATENMNAQREEVGRLNKEIREEREKIKTMPTALAKAKQEKKVEELEQQRTNASARVQAERAVYNKLTGTRSMIGINDTYNTAYRESGGRGGRPKTTTFTNTGDPLLNKQIRETTGNRMVSQKPGDLASQIAQTNNRRSQMTTPEVFTNVQAIGGKGQTGEEFAQAFAAKFKEVVAAGGLKKTEGNTLLNSLIDDPEQIAPFIAGAHYRLGFSDKYDGTEGTTAAMKSTDPEYKRNLMDEMIKSGLFGADDAALGSTLYGDKGFGSESAFEDFFKLGSEAGLKAPEEITEYEKGTEVNTATIASETEKSNKLLQKMLDKAKTEDMVNLSAVTGKTPDQLKTMDKASIKAAIDASTASEYEKGMARVTAGVKDFIFRGGPRGGLITPIDRRDEFLGMKPGGPIDQAMSGGGVVINISGIGSVEECQRVVASTMKRLGYGNVKTLNA